MSLNSIEEKLLAGKWIAGDRISDAIRVSRSFNDIGIKTIINYLGEEYRKKSDINSSVFEYLKLVKEIKRKNVNADIAIKETQVGLLASKSEFLKNYKKIVDTASRSRLFVWLDMEEYEFVSDTIDVYLKFVEKANTGICIQSYLKRSQSDLKFLLKNHAVVRLVKGAHRVKGGDFYDNKGTDRNYFRLMDYLFKNGKTFTIASHDSRIIEKARRLNKKYKRNVTYAMLEGIRDSYAKELVNNGENVSMYVPFGPKWKEYAYRRMKEVGNLKLVIRSLIGG